MKKIIPVIVTLSLSLLFTFNSFASTKPVSRVSVPRKTATIDGVMTEGEWDEATGLTLDISGTTKWSTDKGQVFIEGVYPPKEHTDKDFASTVKLMYSDEYLYYLEWRTDSSPFYKSNDIRKSYCQDGTLIWFVNTDGTVNSISVFADNNGSGPFMMFNKDDKQDEGTKLECEIKSTLSDNGYVIEAKIPLANILLTEAVLSSGNEKVTYCTVNIYNDEFDGDAQNLAVNWAKYGYEPWYIGVNNWQESPSIMLLDVGNNSGSEETVSEISGNNAEIKAVSSDVTEKTDKDGGISSGSLFALVAGIVVIVAAVILIVVLNKKKKVK